MRKTFCDSCGNECTARIVTAQVAEEHLTADGKQAARDWYEPVDLCGPCGDRVKAALRLDLGKFIVEPAGGDFGDMMMAMATSPAPPAVRLQPAEDPAPEPAG